MPRMLLTADPSRARRHSAGPRLARVQAAIHRVGLRPIGRASGQQATIVKVLVDGARDYAMPGCVQVTVDVAVESPAVAHEGLAS